MRNASLEALIERMGGIQAIPLTDRAQARERENTPRMSREARRIARRCCIECGPRGCWRCFNAGRP